jgi:hypothetical protein
LTIKHQEKRMSFIWHCGNAPPSIACQNPESPSNTSILGEILGTQRSMGTGEFQVKARGYLEPVDRTGRSIQDADL